MSGFESELSKYGDVSKGRLGSNDEYFKVKLFGETKNIRLKETCFNSNYIEDRQLLRAKPTDKQVNTLVSEWVNTRSHEMKHIQQASPTLREKYYSLNPEQKEEFLNERRRNHDKKHNLGERRRATNRKLVLNELDLNDLPKSETACQVCPNAVWLEQTENGQRFPKVYCRVMQTIIWSPQEQVEITNCDGLLIGVEEMELEEEFLMEE